MAYGDYSNKSRTHVSDLMGEINQQDVTKAEKSISEKMQKGAEDIYSFAKVAFEKFGSFFVKKEAGAYANTQDFYDKIEDDSETTNRQGPQDNIFSDQNTLPSEESKGEYKTNRLVDGELKIISDKPEITAQKKTMIFSPHRGVGIIYKSKVEAQNMNKVDENPTFESTPVQTPTIKTDTQTDGVRKTDEQVNTVPEKNDEKTSTFSKKLSLIDNFATKIFNFFKSNKDQDIELQDLSKNKSTTKINFSS